MMPSVSRRSWSSLAPLLLSVVLAGHGSCGDRGDGYLPFDPALVATGERDAVAKLRSAYFRLDLTALDALLHEDFTFTMDGADADSLGIDRTWDRARELELTTNMFTGKPGVRLSEVPQPPLDLFNAFDSIQLLPAPGQDDWVAVNAGPYRGSRRRSFIANFTVQFQELDTDFIRGIHEFWIVDNPIEGRYGETYPRFQILHWEDRGPEVFKHQTISWARLKAKFETQ